MTNSNRQAGSSIESGIVGAGECLTERLDDLAGRLEEIDERARNGLRCSEVFSVQKYLHGRFAIVAELSDASANRQHAVIYARPSDIHDRPVIGFDNRVVSKFENANGGNQHVVLLPVSKVVEVDEIDIPSGVEIAMAFYPVSKQPYKISGGLTFKSLRNGVFKVVVIPNRQGSGISFGREFPLKAGPAEITCGPQIKASVADKAGDLIWDSIGEGRLDQCAPFIRVVLLNNAIRLFLDEACDMGFEVVDELFGPYDL